MSDVTSIVAAARERLGQMAVDAGTVFVWPNETAPNSRPYLVFEPGPVNSQIVTLSRTAEVTILIQVTVAVDANTGTGQADRMVQRIIDRFPSGLAVDDGSWVDKPPVIGPSIQDDAEYRVPVTVTIRALLNNPA
jgi:hypothetical protein